MSVACFMLNETNFVKIGLRRYSESSGPSPCPAMPGKWGYHQALASLGHAGIAWTAEKPDGARHWFEGRDGRYGVPAFAYPGRGDPRWPRQCSCGHEFTGDDPWQEWSEQLYVRAGMAHPVSDSDRVTLREAPDGAMWDAYWPGRKGPDGRALMVKCPGGHEWSIDGRASNCTMPEDREHYCWVRHGEPPLITVDKNGATCAAGAGSIQAGDYHGFLVSGEFT